jgi:putative tryptophan/tyrosine transport system substrate-binding protein
MQRRETTMSKQLVFWLLPILLLNAAPITAAQTPKVYHVGVLLPGDVWQEIIDGLRVGLRALGFEEGKQFVLDIRNTKGDLKAAEAEARNLEQRKVDLIYAARTSVTIPARRATKDIPIVFCAGTDPVALGLVESFAKPGGRLTGVYEPSTDLIAKRMAILKEIVPKLGRVLTFYDPRNPVATESVKLAREEAARQMGVQVIERHVASGEEVQAAVRALKAGEVDAYFQVSDSMVNNQVQHIINAALVKKFPTMLIDQANVAKGGLASYSVNYYEVGRLSAKYVQRILSGVRPSDLPVEGVDKLLLVVNLKTAKQIGLTIPPNVLARADKVIR